MRVAALSGSLRAASTNTAFLRELARSAPAGISVRLHERLAELPPFDPDRAGPSPTGRSGGERPGCTGDEAVAALVELVREADAVVVACPEYAGGPPGAFKNALDHLVGTDAFAGKPFAHHNLSPRASLAQASLATVLGTMGGARVAEACLTLELSGAPLAPGAMARDAALLAAVRGSLEALARAVRGGRDPAPPTALANPERTVP